MERNKLERLEKKLYSRKAPEVIDPGRSDLEPDTFDNDLQGVNDGWQADGRNRFDALA